MIGGEWKWADGIENIPFSLVQGRFVFLLIPLRCDFSRWPARCWPA